MRSTGAVTLRGNYRGLFIKTSGSGVTVSGSLSKYWSGSNVIAPTFYECREALQGLEEKLGSSLGAMRVYRIDIAATLNMKHPYQCYLGRFGQLSRFRRFDQNGGLLYKTQRRELIFYDKQAEVRIRKATLPKCFNGRYALRYELRYRQQLREQFGGTVTAERLIDPGFFRDVVRRWETCYDAIQKQTGTLAMGLETSNVKSFAQSLERAGIERLGGEVALLEELRLRRIAGEVDRLNYSRIRAKIIRLCRQPEPVQCGDYIRELDAAILEESGRLGTFE